MKASIIAIAIAAAVLAGPAALAQGSSKKPSCCAPAAAKSRASSSKSAKIAGAPSDAPTDSPTVIPDAVLLDQNGNQVHLRELVRGKVVAMNFVFTTCTTICPPMGANFAKLNTLVGSGGDVMLVSISIDPTTDTPVRLKAWSEKFNAGPGWTLLTGGKREVDNLLKTLKVYAPVKENHAPIVLIGREGESNWVRANGLTAPEKLAEIIRGRLAAAAPGSAAPAAATPAVHASAVDNASAVDDSPELKYFTDVKLSDQFGEEHRLYSDLLKGKIVVINPFFEQCTGSCPVMNTTMEQLQAHLGERLGRDVVILSITVDPVNDTPSTLKDYAARFHAKRGWYFLSGKRENVELALRKLGQYVETRESHSTVVLIGNVSTRLWKKVNGLAPAANIIEELDGVIADTGGSK
jgi:cytochrome oxidase Cu insertion factor (SCO1/SenC/PrrC family)